MGQNDIKLVWSGLESDEVALTARLDPGRVPTGFLDIHQWVELLRQGYIVNGCHPHAHRRMVGTQATPPRGKVWKIPDSLLQPETRHPRSLRRLLFSTGLDEGELGDITGSNGTTYVAATAAVDLGQCGFTEAESWPPDSALPTSMITVASLRADAVLAAVMRISRSEAQTAVANGYLFVNFAPARKASAVVKPGDELIVLGRGRVEVTSLSGPTRSGRHKLELRYFPC